MDKAEHSQMNYPCGSMSADVNLYTGRLLAQLPGISIGAGNFAIGANLVYNSQVKGVYLDRSETGLGNGWKLNLQQSVFSYKTGYNLPGFTANDYVYVDSLGYIHRFTQIPQKAFFYNDPEGSGLTMNTVFGLAYQIIDENGNKLHFNNKNRLTYTESGFNAAIKKIYDYDNNGKLIAVCDERKESRKLEFEYSGDRLTKIKHTENGIVKNTVGYEYDAEGKLIKAEKRVRGRIKDTALLYYDADGKISMMLDKDSKAILKFEYDKDVRVKKVYTGASDFTPQGELKDAWLAGDGLYAGSGFHCGEKGNVYTVYKPTTFFEKTRNEISYEITAGKVFSTTVNNEKEMRLIYFFNNNGRTSAVFERKTADDYRTTFKTSGWSLCAGGKGSVGINGKQALPLNLSDNKYTYTVNKNTENDNNKLFKNWADNILNGSSSPYKYNDRYMLSFWVKGCSGNGGTVTLSYTPEKKNPNKFYAYLDKLPDESWQYVTVPFGFDEYQSKPNDTINADKIEEMKKINKLELSFEGLSSGTTIYIADLRVGVCDYAKAFAGGGDIGRAAGIEYLRVNNAGYVFMPFNTECFMTEADLFQTYKSLYETTDGKFDLVYCGGTNKMSVAGVRFALNDKTYNFSVDGDGIANYYMQTKSRADKSKWRVTETQIRFYGGVTEQKTSVSINSSYSGRAQSAAGRSDAYVWTNNNGTPRETKDAYGVSTIYKYDSYGNPISVERVDANKTTSEKIAEEYGYAAEESLREQPSSVTSNGVTRYYAYDESTLLPSYSTSNECTSEWEYNHYSDVLKEKRYRTYKGVGKPTTLVGKNSLTYDSRARLSLAKDIGGREFYFAYNNFGEPARLYKMVNGKDKNILLDIYTMRTINSDEIRDVDKVSVTYCKNLGTDGYITDTIIDKYGKPRKQIIRNNGKTAQYKYQDEGNPYLSGDSRREKFFFNESSFAAKITQINDQHEDRTYNYHYDYESGGRLTGYSKSGNEGFSVEQKASGTEYKMSGETRVSRVIYEDEEFPDGKSMYTRIAPRIRRTKDTVNNADIDMSNFAYKYDALGRQKEKKHSYGSMNTSGVSTTAYKSGTLFRTTQKYTTTGMTKNSFTYGATYKNGAVNKITEDINGAVSTVEYGYDELGRLKKEGDKTYKYDGKGDLLSIEGGPFTLLNQTLKKVTSCEYNALGQKTKQETYLVGPEGPGGSFPLIQLQYDYYGNVERVNDTACAYERNNVLLTYGGTEYKYNAQGVRFEKKQKGYTKRYYFDGGRVLGEDWYDAKSNVKLKLRYFYDAEGIAGVQMNSTSGPNYNTYYLVRDTQGNVTRILDSSGKVVNTYIYDAWGYVIKGRTNPGSDTFKVEDVNPFRWKGYYYDEETELYEIYTGGRTRFYSPELMMFLDAESPMAVLQNCTDVNGLNRNSLGVMNIGLQYILNKGEKRIVGTSQM